MNSDSPNNTSGQEEQDIFDVLFPGTQSRASDVHQAKRTYCKPDETPLWKKVVEVGAFAAAITFAYIYNGQLTQMRIATEASTRSANLAAEALDENRGQFERMMGQVIHQTAAQVIAANGSTESSQAAKSAAQTAREALVSAQRAFVFTTWDTTTTEDKVRKTVTFHFGWENSGTTPTKDFRSHLNYIAFPADIPIDYPFPDRWGGHPHINFPAVIGPKGKIMVDSGEVPTVVLDLLAKKQTRLYFYGWARYRDIFPKTPEHVTQFCFEFHITDPGAEATSFTNCLRHNCYDDECKNEK